MEGLLYPPQENASGYMPVASSLIERQLVNAMKRGDRRDAGGDPITHEALDMRRAQISSLLGPWAVGNS